MIARERYSACSEFFSLAGFGQISLMHGRALPLTTEAHLFDSETGARKEATKNRLP
jgi:hypothetical protein